jgi:CRP-like cAMP-binding protein
VLINGPGGPIAVATIGKNDFVGEIAILCDVPRTATIRSRTALTTLRITKDLFLRMLMDFPAIAIEVTRVLAQRLEHTTERLRDALARK